MAQHRMTLEHPGPLLKRFPDQLPVQIAKPLQGRLQISHPPMNELSGGGRSPPAYISGLQNFNLPAAPSRRQSDSETTAASPYDD